MKKVSVALFLLCLPLKAQDLLSDQKHILSFPTKLRNPKVAARTAAVVAATAGLMLFDKVDSRYFLHTSSFNEFNRVFNGSITEYGTIAAPAVLMTAGLLRSDPKMTATAISAGEALGDAELLAVVMKEVSRRPGPLPGSGPSFPSGHTVSAFAVATVVAHRYGNHRWVPWVAYGLAGAVGVSRVTSSAHYVSDVFMGAALGYSMGRFGVLHE